MRENAQAADSLATTYFIKIRNRRFSCPFAMDSVMSA